MQLKELLEAGDVFFAPGQPLTLCTARAAAARARGADPGEWDEADSRFVWNRAALAPLLAAGAGPWITPVMQGAILCESVPLPLPGVHLAACLSSTYLDCYRPLALKRRGLLRGGGTAGVKAGCAHM